MILPNTVITLTSLALKWRKKYNDNNPEVGMGPSLEALLDELLDDANLQLTNRDKQAVLDLTTSIL